MLVQDLVADLRRDDVDPLLAVQDASDVGVVEHARRTGQPECGAGDDDGLGGRCRVSDAARRRGCGGRLRGDGRRLGHRHMLDLVYAQPGA